MGLQAEVMIKLKEAMKAKDAVALESLRAIKSAILLEQTQAGGKAELTAEAEIKLLQKLVKQRRDSASIFKEQGRDDLAQPEEAQIEVISHFLPQQLSKDEVAAVIDKVIEATGASSMKDMGKVMGMATKQLSGQADGKTISTLVKQKLGS
ncbi:MAG: GatB/YqeY domain-containing protein [Flavobacteriaceae bacterium]